MSELNLSFTIYLLINMISISILCYGCYFRLNKNADVAGSLVLFGLGIFIITYLLHGVDMSMEFSFGLFAVFTMLRYRTDAISIKEMTYLFLVIAIALLSAVGNLPVVELLLLNGLICTIAYTVDSKLLTSRYAQKNIIYERIDNVKPKNRDKLIADLRDRTGLLVKDVNIQDINFLRDTAIITIHYIPFSETATRYSPIKPIEEIEISDVRRG